ncbi:hypothetical protein J7643_10100 [bacterium]|nr:hypothetical protein [bacterium]
MRGHSNGRLMLAAVTGAVVLAGCAHMMGKRPQEQAKPAMVRTAQPAAEPRSEPAKPKLRQTTQTTQTPAAKPSPTPRPR